MVNTLYMHVNPCSVPGAQSCAAEARDVLSADLRAAIDAEQRGAPGGGAAQRRLTRDEERQLLPRLLRLRQACCHPQVRGRSTAGPPPAVVGSHAAVPP